MKRAAGSERDGFWATAEAKSDAGQALRTVQHLDDQDGYKRIAHSREVQPLGGIREEQAHFTEIHRSHPAPHGTGCSVPIQSMEQRPSAPEAAGYRRHRQLGEVPA
jgi:hypothetical protein